MTEEQIREWFRDARRHNNRPDTFNPVLACTLDAVEDAGIDAMRKFIANASEQFREDHHGNETHSRAPSWYRRALDWLTRKGTGDSARIYRQESA